MALLDVLLPVYNEQERLASGVERSVAYLDGLIPKDYHVVIVDNHSQDATPAIARDLAGRYEGVESIHVDRKGVGVAFRAGVAASSSPLIGYMDVDLSTDLRHLDEVLEIFSAHPEVDLVNGSRWNPDSVVVGRTPLRNLTSHGLTFVLRHALGMRATDAICGFKFFRRPALDMLMRQANPEEDGWFYIIELLLRAERDGLGIAELPVHWEDDQRTTVKVAHQTLAYLTQIRALRTRFKQEGIL